MRRVPFRRPRLLRVLADGARAGQCLVPQRGGARRAPGKDAESSRGPRWRLPQPPGGGHAQGERCFVECRGERITRPTCGRHLPGMSMLQRQAAAAAAPLSRTGSWLAGHSTHGPTGGPAHSTQTFNLPERWKPPAFRQRRAPGMVDHLQLPFQQPPAVVKNAPEGNIEGVAPAAAMRDHAKHARTDSARQRLHCREGPASEGRGLRCSRRRARPSRSTTRTARVHGPATVGRRPAAP